MASNELISLYAQLGELERDNCTTKAELDAIMDEIEALEAKEYPADHLGWLVRDPDY